MNTESLSRERLAALHAAVQPYVRADQVGTLVALILLPLLLGGFGALLTRILPTPLGGWIGGGVLVFTGIMVLFLFAYRFRTMFGIPYVIDGLVKAKRVHSSRYGGESYVVELEAIQVLTLSATGASGEISRWRGRTLRRIVRTRALFGAAAVGDRVQFGCVPGGPVVAGMDI